MRGDAGWLVLLVCVLGSGCGKVETPINLGDDAAPIDIPSPPMDAPPDTPPDAPPDTPPDAPPDTSPKATQFDVGFIDRFTIGWSRSSAGMLGFVVIANKGATPLNLTKVVVLRVEDDDPTINSVFEVEIPSDTTELVTDRAAGALGTPAYARLFEGGVMTETYESTDNLNFAMRFPNQSAAFVGKTLNLKATIQINDAEAVLPISIKFVESATLLMDGGARVSAR